MVAATHRMARSQAQGAYRPGRVNFIMLKLGCHAQEARASSSTVACAGVPLVGLLGGRARSDPERCKRLKLVEVAAP